MSQYDLSNSEVQLTLVLKLQELQRKDLKYVSYENLEDLLENLIWKNSTPSSLHTAVNDVLSITADKVVKYLSKKALIEGYHLPLSDFDELLGGNRNEEE